MNKTQWLIVCIVASAMLILISIVAVGSTSVYVIFTFPDIPPEQIIELLQHNHEFGVSYNNMRSQPTGQYILWVIAKSYGGLDDIQSFMRQSEVPYMYAAELD